MENRNYTVEDVSSNPSYWRKDIDFIITSPTTGATKTFEVKWDARLHETNNLYLEVASAYSEEGLGWYEFCKADYLAYGDATNGTFYIIPLLELRERVESLPKRIGQCGKDSIGLLVSLNKISDIIQIL
jgi:hypothetical protein